MTTEDGGDLTSASEPVRLDKWLWAARFFKTRTLAKEAVESGHVRYEDERTKVSKTVALGARLRIRQGWDDVEVIVQGLSGQRRGAPEAQRLYTETADSQARRERDRLLRQAAGGPDSSQRPSKQQRRDIHRYKRGIPG